MGNDDACRRDKASKAIGSIRKFTAGDCRERSACHVCLPALPSWRCRHLIAMVECLCILYSYAQVCNNLALRIVRFDRPGMGVTEETQLDTSEP